MDLSAMAQRKLCCLCLLESQELIPINRENISKQKGGLVVFPVDTNNFNVGVFFEMLENIGFRELEKELLKLPMPSYVCQRCFKATSESYKFKEQCQKTLEVIRKWCYNAEPKTKMMEMEVERDTDDLEKTDIQSSDLAIQTFGDKYSLKGVKCLQCIRILRNYTKQLEVDELSIENHSEFGYFKGSRCPFCSKMIKHSKAFFQHLNTIHHIVRDEPNGRGHFFYHNSVFIYDFGENEKATSTDLAEFEDEVLQQNDDGCLHTHEDEIISLNPIRETEFKVKKVEPSKKKQKVSTSSVALKCVQCPKILSSRLCLQKHLEKQHSKRFLCKECNESFDSKAELNAHAKVRGHDKPLLCPECGLRCRTSNILMIHSRRHTGEKPFKCTYCSKGFPRSHDLRVHEKYHTNEKSHFCETCGKGFQRKYNLNIHMRVHTGEKPYSCPQCPQAFAQSNDLKAHIRRHTGERFLCELCDATFLLGYQIRHHKLLEHGIIDVPPTQRLQKFLPTGEPKQTSKDDSLGQEQTQCTKSTAN